jgi:hypothetical protein
MGERVSSSQAAIHHVASTNLTHPLSLNIHGFCELLVVAPLTLSSDILLAGKEWKQLHLVMCGHCRQEQGYIYLLSANNTYKEDGHTRV